MGFGPEKTSEIISGLVGPCPIHMGFFRSPEILGRGRDAILPGCKVLFQIEIIFNILMQYSNIQYSNSILKYSVEVMSRC